MFPPAEDKEIFCNECNRETLHEFKGSSSREYSALDDENLAQVEAIENRLYVCAGCGSGTLEVIDANDVNPPEVPENYFFYTYYPPRTKDFLKEKYFQSIPNKLQIIYIEIIHAYNNETPIICAIGIRTLVEGICAARGIKRRNLQDMIDLLKYDIREEYVQKLHTIRFLGNEATHELEIPQEDELKLAIEICESLLDYLYELDSKTIKLTEMHYRRRFLFNKK